MELHRTHRMWLKKRKDPNKISCCPPRKQLSSKFNVLTLVPKVPGLVLVWLGLSHFCAFRNHQVIWSLGHLSGEDPQQKDQHLRFVSCCEACDLEPSHKQSVSRCLTMDRRLRGNCRGICRSSNYDLSDVTSLKSSWPTTYIINSNICVTL